MNRIGQQGAPRNGSAFAIDDSLEAGTLPVRTVLLVSTIYDFFMLEEEGRLGRMMTEHYRTRETGYVPQIVHRMDGSRAMDHVRNSRPGADLVIIFNPPPDMPVLELASKIKAMSPVPVMYLGCNTPELMEITRGGPQLDGVFAWSGDGSIFPSMVQMAEDVRHNVMGEINRRVSMVLAISDITLLSAVLPVVHDEITSHMRVILGETSGPASLARRLARRPRVVLSPVEGADPPVDSCCIITDGARNGESVFLKHDVKLPVMLLEASTIDDCDNGVESKETSLFVPRIIGSRSPGRDMELRCFLRECLGSTLPSMVSDDGTVLAPASLLDFLSIVRALPVGAMVAREKVANLQRWLAGRTEHEAADRLRTLLAPGQGDIEGARVLEVLAPLCSRQEEMDSSILPFTSENLDRGARLMRLGDGALGGKARGIVFMEKVISSFLPSGTFPGVDVGIPRTIVLCTDIFDRFMEANGLNLLDLECMSDERIVDAFLSGDVPPTVLGPLREIARKIRTPLVVRSSSLLEDALFQPFAGVYATKMIPNDSTDVDRRARSLLAAVKRIWASTYLRKARDYLATTPASQGDEKMAVVIQEVFGKRHDNLYYPTISGVARSYNFYPFGKCRPEEGVVMLALGLGKTIVDSGSAFTFCPRSPRTPFFMTVKDMLDKSQKRFWAMELGREGRGYDEDINLVQEDIKRAEDDNEMKFTASTYSVGNDRVYPGLGHEGPRILDFQMAVSYGMTPLPDILMRLLEACRVAMGYPVEIEFAMNLHPEDCLPASFSFLQARTMVTSSETVDLDPDAFTREEVLLKCESVQGNGMRDDILDIIYVRPDGFELSKTPGMVADIRHFNNLLKSHDRPYLLVGPGRWGSSDHFLGIPVNWSDIAGTAAVIETPVYERPIDPSQGSHFFQNMTSRRVSYFTMDEGRGETLDWEWLASRPGYTDRGHVRHVHLTTPLGLMVDGRRGLGLVVKDPGARVEFAREGNHARETGHGR